MKLLYITNGITGSGGLERVLSVKASMLAEQLGYEVHLLSLNEEDQETFFEFSSKIIRHSLTVGGNPLRYMKSYKNGIQQKVREIQPDVISVCDDAMKGFFLPHLIKTKAKWIHESHASLLLGDQGKGLSFLKKMQHQSKQILGKQFSKVVLLTERNRKEWNLDNLVVIPNPVSFYPENAASLSSHKIIAVGSHSYNKGYDLLLTAWQKVESRFPDWNLVIYGKSVDNRYQDLANSLGLQHVNFHHPSPRIDEKYLEASVFVLPSRSEGFGMVIIEAMACGVPVVSFDCPHGPGDIITHGTNGWLVEKGNTVEMAEHLAALMNDPALRLRFGIEGRMTAQNYCPQEIVDRWDCLFKSLIEDRKV